MNEREIFLSALEIEDEAAREAHVQSACAGDAALQARVESLLTMNESQSQFLETPVVQQMATRPDADPAPTLTYEYGSTEDEELTKTEYRSDGADAMTEKLDDDDSDEIPLGYLQPSERPGALGRLDNYDVLQVLGRGAFGIVLKAMDEKLQRVVAIKVLAPQIATTSPARKRFLREAQASAQIRHENVVSIHNIYETPLPYLVMEYIPGQTLQQRLDDKGPLDVVTALRFGRQIAEGLAAAHEQDLIHRDIKPGNILLEGGVIERVKITDFGLARAADDASMTQSGVIAGTPMYMAPEQALGKKLDQRADLFSLGSVLYQMVSGRPPFRAANTLAVLKRVTEDDPRPIQEIIPETPQWLCDIIAKLHAKDPDQRFQSAREVAELFADCEEQLKANSRLKDFSRIPRSKPRTAGRWKVTAVAALVALLVAFGLYSFYRPAAPLEMAQINLSKSPISESTKPDATESSTQGTEQAPPLAIAPFDAAQARAHQEAWAMHLGVPVEFENSIGMRFRLIPPGEFMMGTSPEEAADVIDTLNDEWAKDAVRSETPSRKVQILQPFYLATTEVTVGQFKKFVAATNYKTTAETNGKGGFAWTGTQLEARPEFTWHHADCVPSDMHPVRQVGPPDAEEFCRWLSGFEARNYRLPDEEQWEYACRAGTVTARSFSDDAGTLEFHELNKVSFVRAVAQKPANPFGLYDVHGNVGETCWSKRGGHFRRGGYSESNFPWFSRSAARFQLDPQSSDRCDGFRVAIVGDLKPRAVPYKQEKQSLAETWLMDAFVQRVAALPAEQQVEEVRKKLMEFNPGFDGKMETKIENGAVTEFKIVTDNVTNIAPIRVFNALQVLDCHGTYTDKGNGQLADLTPLTGIDLEALRDLNLDNTKVGADGLEIFKDCKNLQKLHLWNTKVNDASIANFKDCKNLTVLGLGGTQVSDAGLIHFKGCKNLTGLYLWSLDNVSDAGVAHFQDCKNLTWLNLGFTHVGDAGLIHFKDCKALTTLELWGTKANDAGLAYFRGLPLMILKIQDTSITDLTPLQGMPLEEIHLTPKNITRGLDILREMKSLKTIGISGDKSWPPAEFWQRYDKGEFGFAPFTDADVKRIATLPAEQQVEEVRKELMRRNPGFDGKMETKIEDGVVTELRFNTDNVTDIFPIRVFHALRVLDCRGSNVDYMRGAGQLSDLTPLNGMNLNNLTHIDLNWTKVGDTGIASFKDCKDLTYLGLSGTKVTDDGLAHFKDCNNLTMLFLYRAKVSDVGMANFKGCKSLNQLVLGLTEVSDAGLVHFKDCKDLDLLDLAGTKASGAGLEHFKDSKNLAVLALGYTPISDAGLACLKVFKNLRTLSLHNTEVSDAGLIHLNGLDELTEINLLKTRVSAKGVEGLAKKFPTCKIKWDGGVIEPR